MNEHTLL